MAFRKNTTFVIGAGASAEFGLPVGSQLATRIKLTAGSVDAASGTGFFDHLINSYYDRDERRGAYQAMNAIRDGIHTAVSIDAFIHRMNSNKFIQQLGKALIAYEILKAERESTLSESTGVLFRLLKDAELVQAGTNKAKHPDYTWITHFFKILADGIEDPTQLGKNVPIICFNYDRCIEFFLTQTIASAYGISPEESLEIVDQNFNIIHPYGTLGKISLDHAYHGDGRVPFGDDADTEKIWERITKGIKTYTEQSHDVGNVKAIQSAIASCKNLVFLGFGFNNQNLDLLRVKHLYDTDTAKRNVYATGLGLFQQIDETLKRRIMDLFIDSSPTNQWPKRIQVEYGADCSGLFRIPDMTLSSFEQHVVEVNPDESNPVSRIVPYRGLIT